ncbi:MAG: glycosyltransferase [Eubacteriales bacterium]
MKVSSRRMLLFATIIANIIYILWRIFCTIPNDKGWFSLIFAIGLLIVEIVGMFEMFVHFYGMSDYKIPEIPVIDYDLYPEVDIFIATYNEPVDLVRKTIYGAKHIRYPDKKKVHIHVCDDGSREEMRLLCEEMGVSHITRKEHDGAKAGNLNNAMKFTNAPYIVTLDADMIPMHDFLMATVPYFLKNAQAKKNGEKQEHQKIGFIQTPQCFYNTDLFQFNLHSEGRIPNEQDYFYRDIQTAKNASNTVIYGGSNTILCREAIDEIGGFYTNSITEDFATGMLIQSKGYVCYAISDVYASGLSPDDLKSLIKQRERWGRGCIQTGRRVNLIFMKGLTFGQKISYLSSISYWYASVKRFFYIMAPIVFAVFGIQVVDCTLIEVLCFWLPTYLLTSTSLKKMSGNIRNTRWTNVYETIMFQSMMFSVIFETFGISKNKFSVTRKDKNQTSDSSYRLKQAIPFVGYIILSIIGICNMVYYTFVTGTSEFVVVLFWLIANLFNLAMVIFFLAGRKQLRSSERFVARLDCVVTQDTLHMECSTVDVSETGFSFVSSVPEYIDPDQTFEIVFTMDAGDEVYTCKTNGKIAQVIQTGDNWKYACSLVEEDRLVLDQWYLMVHDRVPSLPQTIEGSLGFYEDLEVNIKKRVQSTPFFNRKTARMYMNAPVVTENAGVVTMKNFNYKYMLAEFQGTFDPPLNMAIKIAEGVILRGTLSDGVPVKMGQLYTVDNISIIMSDGKKRKKLMEWLKQVASINMMVEAPKVQTQVVGDDEEDLMQRV